MAGAMPSQRRMPAEYATNNHEVNLAMSAVDEYPNSGRRYGMIGTMICCMM
jgi:hypothetical protein